MQSGGGSIKGPSSAEPGTTIEIVVQNGATEVEVGLSGGGNGTKFPVGPDGKCSVPVPFNSAGRYLIIHTTGKPPNDSVSIPIILTD